MKLTLVCVVLAVAACKKSEPPPASTAGSGSAIAVAVALPDARPTNAFVDKMAELTDKLCACTDLDCASNANDELVKFTVASARGSSGPPGTAEDQARIDKLQQRFADCTTRLQASVPPPSPPPSRPTGSAPARTAGCAEMHEKVSAYASCDKITSEQRDAMFAAVGPIDTANDDAKCTAQSATLVADAGKLFACDIAAVGVKKAGPPTPQCAALAKRLPGFVACDKLAFGWAEKLRSEAAAATDPNDDKACAAVIAEFADYVKDRFPACAF